jgi:hypothetical protein
MFLFLLSLPLKKLPIIDVTDYRPPAWVLPVFAIGSFVAVVFCVTVSLSLATFRAAASKADFERSFEVVRTMTVSPGPLQSAKLSVLEYDGSSNFRLFVNGYRVFGSSSNCVMNYQCKKADDETAEASFIELQKLALSRGSIYHIHKLYSLPHVEDISGFLVEGTNYIDIHVENSGVGDCVLKAAVEFSSPAKSTTVSAVSISPDAGVTSSAEKPLQVDEVFYSGGLPVAENAASDIVPLYNTIRSNGSYRLCQRVRIQFDLTKDQLSVLSARWHDWAEARGQEQSCAMRPASSGRCQE